MVNSDAPEDLETGTMPFVRNGNIYVPESTLEQLGLTFIHHGQGRVQVACIYGSGRYIIFDLETGDSLTRDGEELSIMPLSRFGALFFPVGSTDSVEGPLADYLGINLQILPTEPAPMVRLYNAPVGDFSHNLVLNNAELLFGLTERYEAFVDNAPGEADGAVVGSPSFPETPPPTQPEARPPAPAGPVSLSFVGLTENTGLLLDALHIARVPAGFFVTADEVFAHPDLVRRLHGEGHQVGIFLQGNAGEEYKAASEALFEVARLWTVLVAARTPELASAADQLGLVVFDSNIREVPSAAALESFAGHLLLDKTAPGSASALVALPGELRSNAMLVVSFVRSLG